MPHEPPRASTYQFRPRHMLYRTDGRWTSYTPAQAGEAIRGMLPAHLQHGWRHICSGLTQGPHESEAARTAAWIQQNGERLGFRPPNTEERARGLGWPEYQLAMGLTEHELYNAQGNAFDATALYIRLRPGIAQWQTGGLPPAASLDPCSLQQAYSNMRPYWDQHGVTPRHSPFPDDLADALRYPDGLCHLRFPEVPRTQMTPSTITTAQGGRRRE